MSIGAFSVWAAGILNGYNTEKGLPALYKYGLMSVVSSVQIVRVLGEQKVIPARPAGLLASIFVGIPMVVGATFCTGTFLGKSIHHVKNTVTMPKERETL
jgi:hypothetical protein